MNKKIILTITLILGLLMVNSCMEDEKVKEIYLEGEPISGIEIQFPLGYYGFEALMPKISPDGKKLLFNGLSGLSEWRGLWVFDLDSRQRTLLHPNGRAGDWAPDSEWIAFNSGSQIYKMKIDGTGITQLTFEGRNFLPVWSPDGENIAFDGDTSIVIIDKNGAVINSLQGAGGMPDWRGDGSAIIGFKGFSSTSIWTKLTVFDVTLNKVTRILDAAINEDNRFPRISHNNKQITFINSKGIWVMDADGEALRRILPNHLLNPDHKERIDLYANTPSWYPDSKHLVYEHFKITNSERTQLGWRVEGIIQFYKVNVRDAVTASNL